MLKKKQINKDIKKIKEILKRAEKELDKLYGSENEKQNYLFIQYLKKSLEIIDA